MFISISKIEQAVHHIDSLQNPKNPNNPMLLGIYRQRSRTVLFTVYTKKAFAEYWDQVEQKRIPSRLWTPEMKRMAKQQVIDTAQAPFIFKLTIVGWLFMLIMVAALGLAVYEGVKPPVPKSAEYVSMEQPPLEGDIYFGRYEAFKESGDRIANDIGFGWFKVVKAEEDVYHMAKSVDMSNVHKPKEQLGNTDFEAEGTPVKITEQKGYMVNLKAVDGKMEIYLTDKK